MHVHVHMAQYPCVVERLSCMHVAMSTCRPEQKCDYIEVLVLDSKFAIIVVVVRDCYSATGAEILVQHRDILIKKEILEGITQPKIRNHMTL